MHDCRRAYCPKYRSLPSEVVNDLKHNYSQKLYGARHRVNIDRIRVVWPALLSPLARWALRKPNALQCSQRDGRAQRETHLFFDVPKNGLQGAALFVHQPDVESLPREQVAPSSFSWVEVSHCFYSAEATAGRVPSAWFFMLPGSGLFLNVGRTAHLDTGYGGQSQHFREKMHNAVANGDLNRLDVLMKIGVRCPLARAPGLSICPSCSGSPSITPRRLADLSISRLPHAHRVTAA